MNSYNIKDFFNKLSKEDKKVLSFIPDTQLENFNLNLLESYIDRAWDELKIKNIEKSKLSQFYSHPIWILNGYMSEIDTNARTHREVFSHHLKKVLVPHSTVMDFGGGYGSFAKILCDINPTFKVDIFDPFPTELARENIKNYQNVGYIDDMQKNEYYDAIVAIDVLEHVTDPLDLFYTLSTKLKNSGIIITANCFYPVIKCHLPENFHLRYTFKFFGRFFGLKFLTICTDSHGLVFIKEKSVNPNWTIVRFLERLSKIAFPFLRIVHYCRDVLR